MFQDIGVLCRVSRFFIEGSVVRCWCRGVGNLLRACFRHGVRLALAFGGRSCSLELRTRVRRVWRRVICTLQQHPHLGVRVPLGPLASSSSQHRRTPEIFLYKGFRVQWCGFRGPDSGLAPSPMRLEAGPAARNPDCRCFLRLRSRSALCFRQPVIELRVQGLG